MCLNGYWKMEQFSKLNGITKPKPFQKKAASPKSLMSRGNLLRKAFFMLLAAIIGFVGCSKDKDDNITVIDSTYKILMVFVTDINVTAPPYGYSPDLEEITVDYKMSDYERQMLTTFSSKMSDWLNGALEGIVKIDVDYYFTTVKLTNKDFLTVYQPTIDDIPEISKLIDDYGSVIITLYMTEKGGEKAMMFAPGFSTGKSSVVYLENFYGFTYHPDRFQNKSNYVNVNGNLTSLGFETIMNLMDEELVIGHTGLIPWFMNVMNIYVHEFTHSVGLQSGAEDVYQFHDAMSAVSKFMPEKDMLEPVRLYLRGEAFTIEEGPKGRKVGVPRSYWK